MIKGSMVAIVTPMHSNETLDFISLERLLNLHREAGTDAIVIAGSTGEAATLELDEYKKLIQFAVQHVPEIPIVAGIGANSTTEAILLAQTAKEAGAVAGLSVVPYYNKPTQEGMYRHFIKIAEETRLPQILYNIPGRTACDMSNETILRLAEIPSIIGLKDATSNMARAFELLSAIPDHFALYSGDDETALPFMLIGGHGVISVVANILPKLMKQLCDSALSGDVAKAREINQRFIKLYKALSLETNPIPIKFAMYTKGFMQDGIRLPLTKLSKKYYDQMMLALDGI